MAGLKELRFSFRHEGCWLQETTERHAVTLAVSRVYNVDRDVHVDLTVHGASAETRAQIRREWEADPRIRKVAALHQGHSGDRFYVVYESEATIWPYIVKNTPLVFDGITMTAGVERYRFVGESQDIDALVRELAGKGDIQVLALKDLEEVKEPRGDLSGADLASSLTDRQYEALLLAHEAGYYGWPRTVSAGDVAKRMGLSNSSFLSHLRQAEARVLDQAIGQMREERPAPVRGEPTAPEPPDSAPDGDVTASSSSA